MVQKMGANLAVKKVVGSVSMWVAKLESLRVES
jgi:hypothetical protein